MKGVALLSMPFGAHPEADREYIDLLLSDISKQKEIVALPGILKIIEIRNKIPGFLTDCLNSIDWLKYSIAGFSTSSQQNCSCLALAKLLKELYPHIKIVFGGANCSGPMAKALIRSFSFIDYVCQGEGDIVFPLLVKGLLKKKDIDVNSIPGIFSRPQIKSGFNNEKTLSVKNMDDLAVPDFTEYFSFLKNNPQNNTFEVQLPLETSRGCWWGERKRCVFCGHCFEQDMAFKSKSPRRAIKEIDRLSREYINTFRFADDIMDYKYYSTLLPDLSKKRRHNNSFFWEVKANISKKNMERLSRAGVNRIQPGIESLSDDTLKLINKGTTQFINISALKWAKEFCIHTSWNLLYGFPKEDYAEYENMIRLIPLLYHLEPPFGCSHIRFERFSSYANSPNLFGINKLRPAKVYNLIYRSLDTDNINDMAFYFDAEYQDMSKRYETELIKAVENWREKRDASLDLFSSEALP